METRWNPDFERQVAAAAKPAISEIAKKRTRQYDELIARYEDGDIDVVKAKLSQIYKADGGEITDPELTAHAKAIVAGTRIQFRVE